MWAGSKAITADDASGNYLHYGVREFGMSADHERFSVTWRLYKLTAQRS